MDKVLLFWALPGLNVLYWAIQWGKRENQGTVESLSADYWCAILLISTLWPLGAVVMFFKLAWPALIKERRINRR